MDGVSPGKPDASAFLHMLDEHYHIGLYGGVEVLRARLRPDLSPSDPDVTRALATWGGEVHVEVRDDEVDLVLIRPGTPVPTRWLLHAALLLATLVTTLTAGALLRGYDPMDPIRLLGGWVVIPAGLDLRELWQGAWFGLPILGILLAHESGHYLAARRHRIPVTLPYFLPFPPHYSLIGTLGAFIKIRGPTVRRSVLLDVAAAGPYASFLLSLPALLVGLAWSEPTGMAAGLAAPFVVEVADLARIQIGNGPLIHLLGTLYFPDTFGTVAIALHPLAFAGWLGMFVTALNLLPLGQLDGGHILYCLWEQPRQVHAARVFVLALVPLGFLWWGWWLWGGAALLVNRGRLRHPPVLQPVVPLDPVRAWLARIAILMFFLTFVPVPLST